MKKIYSLLLIFLMFSLCYSQTNKIDSAEIKDLKERKEKLNKLLFQDLPKIQEKEKQYHLLEEAEKITTPKLGNFIVYINTNKGRINESWGKFPEAMSNYKKAYKVAIDFNDKIGSARSLQAMGIFHCKKSNYDSCATYIKKAVDITRKNLYNPIVDSTKNKILLMNLLSNLGTMHLIQKKNKEALVFFNETLPVAKQLKQERTEALTYGYLGGLYTDLNDFKNATKFINLERKLFAKLNDLDGLSYGNLHLATVFKLQKRFAEAKPLILQSLKNFTELKNVDGIQKSKQNLFTLYRLSNDYKNAHAIEDEVIEIIKKNGNAESLAHVYTELGEIYTKEKNFSAAEKYFAMSEKILNENNYNKNLYYRKLADLKQAQGKTVEALEIRNKELATAKVQVNPDFINNISEFDVKYRVAEKDLKLKQQQLALKTKELQIANEKANRNYALSGIGVLILLSGGGFLYYRNKKKREDLQKQNTMLSLQKSLNEMQLQNLNKQLNPHEVKNLLAGLSLEMQEKAPKSYENMVRFFNLTKASLYNDSLTESLEVQLKQAEDFIALEQQIMTEPIDFKIEKNINTEKVEIPRLLIKNLLENSVKHGIKGNAQGGTISLKLADDKEFITLEVDDTGKGRTAAISKDSGIGTSTYINLFKTLNKTNERKAIFDIIDKEVGTKVVVKIPKNYNYS